MPAHQPTQEDDLSGTEEMEHTPVFYTGSLPGPQGQVAKLFHSKFTMDTQRTHALDLFTFLYQHPSDRLDLNSDDVPRTALVNLPASSKVRLVYGLGFGTRQIGAPVSSITGRYVMLHGENEEAMQSQWRMQNNSTKRAYGNTDDD